MKKKEMHFELLQTWTLVEMKGAMTNTSFLQINENLQAVIVKKCTIEEEKVFPGQF